MVMSILVEVTMFMMVVVVVAVSSVSKIAITTKPPSETSPETPGKGRSLLKPMILHVVQRLVVVHLKVILKVAHLVLILVIGLSLVVNTGHAACRRHHHQKRRNLSTR